MCCAKYSKSMKFTGKLHQIRRKISTKIAAEHPILSCLYMLDMGKYDLFFQITKYVFHKERVSYKIDATHLHRWIPCETPC